MKTVSVLVNAKDVLGRIRPEVYGHFSEHLGRCIYEGIYVGEDSDIPNVKGMRTDLVEAFRNIRVPVLRWPGGCFAEEYHWKDGIGPKESRKKTVNTNWGGVLEDNSFGTHEFMELCRQVGCKPYINANVGSGTVQEMAEWIEYMTSDAQSPMADLRRENGQEEPWKVEFLGIGNENWGCGGSMRAQAYADVYRRYQSFCRNYAGNRLYKIACGPSSADYAWMETMMQNLDANLVNAIDLHYYTMPIWPGKESATEFDEEMYYKFIGAAHFADRLLTGHSEIMNRYDPEKKIGLVIGEWGCWHEVEPGTNPGFLYQQNTMRDAMVAGIELNIFNKHCDRVVMANLAQAVNVLQSLILTEGRKLVKTPTYHVFDLYKEHQGADAVYCYAEKCPVGPHDEYTAVTCSASLKRGCSAEGDQMTLTLTNCSLTEEISADIDVRYFPVKAAAGRVLTGDAHDYNDFDFADKVKPAELPVKITENGVSVQLPPCSVAEIILQPG